MQHRPKNTKIQPDDPNLLELLKKHLDDGWSPASFGSKLVGGVYTWRILMEKNEEFRVLIEQAKARRKKERYESFYEKNAIRAPKHILKEIEDLKHSKMLENIRKAKAAQKRH